MGTENIRKTFYEVLVDGVYEEKGSLDVSLLSTPCRFNGVDTRLSDHTKLANWSVQGVDHGVYLRCKLSTRGQKFFTIKGGKSVRKLRFGWKSTLS